MKALFSLLMMMSFSAHSIEDPTRPQRVLENNNENAVSLPRLTSILFGAERRWAVINGEVVTEGESVSGFELSAIKRYGVVLVRGDENVQLSLNKEVFGGTDI